MPPVEARMSATVLLLRDGPGGVEVFMLVRHESLAFAAGALVFPGGTVDPDDALIAETLPQATPIQVAAIRESFEECGILLARPAGSQALLSAAHLASLPKSLPFHCLLASERLRLATDLLVPFAHWITPLSQKRRYDTHFLLAPAPNDQVGLHDGTESTHSAWLTPAAALAAVDAGTYKMVFPTRMNLLKLAHHATIAAALEAARQTTPVTVLPEPLPSPTPGLRRLRIPLEAGYGGEIFDVDLPPSI